MDSELNICESMASRVWGFDGFSEICDFDNTRYQDLLLGGQIFHNLAENMTKTRMPVEIGNETNEICIR